MRSAGSRAVDLEFVGFTAHMSSAISFSVFVVALLCPYTSAVPDQRVMPRPFSPMQNAAVDYADMRARVAHAFAEKAHEMSAVITVLQTLSRETAALTEAIQTHCGVKMDAAPIAGRNALRG